MKAVGQAHAATAASLGWFLVHHACVAAHGNSSHVGCSLRSRARSAGSTGAASSLVLEGEGGREAGWRTCSGACPCDCAECLGLCWRAWRLVNPTNISTCPQLMPGSFWYLPVLQHHGVGYILFERIGSSERATHYTLVMLCDNSTHTLRHSAVCAGCCGRGPHGRLAATQLFSVLRLAACVSVHVWIVLRLAQPTCHVT